jgi:adenosylcobinamide-GDP ribazoletransferase
MGDNAMIQAAAFMPAFPLIGGIIGLICGVFVWILEALLPSMIVGFLGLGFILLLTGLHHTDGLLDFGDGAMSHGTKKAKLRIMRDPTTGAGGFGLGLIVLSTTALGIAAIDRGLVIQSLIVTEAAAKLAMVVQAAIGQSAHKGMSTPFIETMHKLRGLRLGVALALQLVISIILLQFLGLALTAAALIVALMMLIISLRVLGGITGDVMGATNDLTRMICLLLVVVAAKWV